jgi:toxin ParE1/3/4
VSTHYAVHLIADAEEDLLQIYGYVLRRDSKAAAEHFFERLSETCESLASVPERGHVPPELERIGVAGFREVHWKPYRIVYQIVDANVYIYCILDGRRDLNDLLRSRLVR